MWMCTVLSVYYNHNTGWNTHIIPTYSSLSSGGGVGTGVGTRATSSSTFFALSTSTVLPIPSSSMSSTVRLSSTLCTVSFIVSVFVKRTSFVSSASDARTYNKRNIYLPSNQIINEIFNWKSICRSPRFEPETSRMPAEFTTNLRVRPICFYCFPTEFDMWINILNHLSLTVLISMCQDWLKNNNL